MYLVFLFFASLCCLPSFLFGQNLDLGKKKQGFASYTAESPKIDGILDEAAWQEAPVMRDFTENSPSPNRPSSQETHVRILYGTEAIYIGARMYDSAPDSILKQLSIRDEIRATNADYFAVHIDAMLTQQNSFRFVVTAANVQGDDFDGSALWDAVWRSNVHFDSLGWTVEMEIPYSQLRFPKSKEQVWGINFERSIRRIREISYWSAIDPAINNNIQQFGILHGIERIDPPIRLSFTPYTAGYLVLERDAQSNKLRAKPSFTAGADLRYGINESFTLDVALIPDFGDVLSDDFQFNISPFEIYYDERRPFFTEGTELFNRAGLFYSRRVGSRPSRSGVLPLAAGESVAEYPEQSQLINALKLSGRTKGRMGIGVFNAITAPSYASVQNAQGEELRRERVESLTNYNVLVVDQQIQDNSYVSFTSSSVIRAKGFTSAFVQGTDFRLVDKKNVYGLIGTGAFSYRLLDEVKFGPGMRDAGFRYNLRAEKLSGRLRGYLSQNTISPNFNINDLGFMTTSNFMLTTGYVNYNFFEPFWIYNNMRIGARAYHQNQLVPSRFMRTEFDLYWSGTFKNFLSAGMDMAYQPWGYVDIFEARIAGQPWRKPTWGRIGGWLSSDYRKPLAVDARASYRKFFAGAGDAYWQGSDILELSFSPRIRFSNRLNMVLSNWVSFRANNIGFVRFDAGQPIFGSRYRQDMETSISVNYLFNEFMNLSFRLRHYWALVDYSRFYEIDGQGELWALDYPDKYNSTFNAFNIDLIYRWIFTPGSEINIVWKNAILRTQSGVQYNYWENIEEMFALGSVNQFSIKALYFLDYFRIFNSSKNKGKRLEARSEF